MNQSTFIQRIKKHYPHLACPVGNHIMNNDIWDMSIYNQRTLIDIRAYGSDMNIEFYGRVVRATIYEYVRNNIDMINLKLL